MLIKTVAFVFKEDCFWGKIDFQGKWFSRKMIFNENWVSRKIGFQEKWFSRKIDFQGKMVFKENDFQGRVPSADGAGRVWCGVRRPGDCFQNSIFDWIIFNIWQVLIFNIWLSNIQCYIYKLFMLIILGWYFHIKSTKAWDSRITNMTFPCIRCEIHKYTNTQIHLHITFTHYIYT